VGLASLMAAQIAAASPEDLWGEGDRAVLVPVAPDPWRRRRRGVDHTGRLAAELGARVGRPVASVLARAGPRRRHVRQTRTQRLRADPGAVQVRTRARGLPATAILVDDVHTTGATLHACALALKGSGVANVVAVTYARTLA
jgi:predicted amidophosphoribosyltransferase